MEKVKCVRVGIMNKQDRIKNINSLKEICQEIGCSGLDPDMCQNRPYLCEIIKKLVTPTNQSFQEGPQGAWPLKTTLLAKEEPVNNLEKRALKQASIEMEHCCAIVEQGIYT